MLNLRYLYILDAIFRVRVKVRFDPNPNPNMSRGGSLFLKLFNIWHDLLSYHGSGQCCTVRVIIWDLTLSTFEISQFSVNVQDSVNSKKKKTTTMQTKQCVNAYDNALKLYDNKYQFPISSSIME